VREHKVNKIDREKESYESDLWVK